jgi:hypothetical protein
MGRAGSRSVKLRGESDFRWRGGEVSRLEALADAAFAFALTLLVISSEVPRNFAELKDRFVELPVFLACATVLIMVWYFHFRYHRRFGFEDFPSVLFNAALLILVLFYVYPLKFMMTFLWAQIRGADTSVLLDTGERVAMLTRQDGQLLMYVYGGGFAAIYGLLALMYVHAWRHREALDLSDSEQALCRIERNAHLLSAAVGVLACGIAVIGPRWVGLAGMSFFLLPIGHTIHGILAGRRYRKRFGE